MERLNIAFYTDVYLPGVDGVVTSILNIKKELESRGHNVYIFAVAAPKNIKKYSSERVFLYHGAKFKPYPQYNVALFPYNSVFKLIDLKIDIVHAQTPMVMGLAGLTAARLLRKPIVASFHTLVTDKPILDAYYPKNRHLKKLAADSMDVYMKMYYNNCNRVIAPSESVSKMLDNMGIKRISVVPNCIDTKIMNPKASGAGIRKEYGISKKEKVVLYLGRLSREKRLEILLKAAKILMKKDGSIRLMIGGTGPAEQHYKDTARKLGIMHKTIFTGFVPNEKLPNVYAASDLLCLPSTFETQGIVLIEAMAVGKPVVGADFMAIKEMIKDGKNGEKFRPGDYTSCARKIEKVLNNTGYYRQNAINTATEFSSERVADKLIDVYNLVLSKKAIY